MLLVGHEHGAATVLQLVVDVVGLQPLDDARRLFAIQLAEQDAVLGAIEVPGRADDQAQDANEHGGQRDQLRGAERGAHDLALFDQRLPLHGKECHGGLDSSDGWTAALDGHPHDFLVGVHQLVAHLHAELQRQVGPLQRDHRVVHVELAVEHPVDGGVGAVVALLDRAHEPRERGAEALAAVSAAGWRNRRRGRRADPGDDFRGDRVDGHAHALPSSSDRETRSRMRLIAVRLAWYAREAPTMSTISSAGLMLGSSTKPSLSASGCDGS